MVEIQPSGWNISLQPVGTRVECSENSCSTRKQLYFSHQMQSVSNFQWNCFPIHLLCKSQLYKKENVIYVREGKKLLFLHENRVGRKILHPTAQLCISSRLQASLEALPSFAVSTRYESHDLSLGFVKWRGQFPLSNCSLFSCEKNAKSGEEPKIIIIFLEVSSYGACIPLECWPESLAFAHSATNTAVPWAQL